jgi:hypothetical protein
LLDAEIARLHALVAALDTSIRLAVKWQEVVGLIESLDICALPPRRAPRRFRSSIPTAWRWCLCRNTLHAGNRPNPDGKGSIPLTTGVFSQAISLLRRTKELPNLLILKRMGRLLINTDRHKKTRSLRERVKSKTRDVLKETSP